MMYSTSQYMSAKTICLTAGWICIGASETNLPLNLTLDYGRIGGLAS